jgi:hypothetical protein
MWFITQVDCYSYFKKNFVKYSTFLFKIPYSIQVKNEVLFFSKFNL